MNKSDLENFGFLKIDIPKDINLVEEIQKLKKEKNAVILGHYYIEGDLQDVSDYVGDSLQLSQQAAKTDADIIVFLGVHFMAETAKILSPNKKVIIPDLKASCSLAESCPENDFAKFIQDNPGHTVISYVNTTAAIKALTDIVVTSSNAKQIVDSLPKDEKIIFGPDKNLGNYINSITGRNMLLWDGACHVHKQFDLEAILKIKSENPDAKIIAHPECESPVLVVSEHIGSTSSLLKFTQTDTSKKFIVATESGILHQMIKASPDKIFIPAPALDSTCACNDCNFMKLNTMEKLYNCLKYELPEITINEQLRQKAEKSIIKMLEISEKFGIK
ncbi:MAG: quinolinate synthase NadA [Bacteroidales bacterium]|jgi:quinolinate synthase|nr:quinolinate synthase NadA [Bacteroidales bacterium]OQC46070.1 MAG: Quinolinate synthase A [Bacteroidetes bacterium ADurb.Bin028]MCK9497946.1 quinolinate synthase NadA [Bacteroidales bacterium]MDY0315182.1 quinolinate synthase NadA [Bacteroidales bacterium]HNY43401.1 quinolinate synthase NadA [Bacteroidales bacterium]